MKRLLVAVMLSLLIPAFASADYMLPEGCYVAYSNPGYCLNIPVGETLIWTASTDQTFLINAYGQIAAVIISVSRQYELDANQCVTDYNNLVTQYNTRGTQMTTLSTSLNAQKKLVTKLRKKCGKPCKKIK